MKLLHNIVRLVAVGVFSFVLSFFFACVADVVFELWFYGSLKLETPSLFIRIWLILFIMSSVFAVAVIGLYNVNRTFWDLVHENRDEFLIVKLVPDIKAIVDFYLDVGNYLFNIKK